jgi:hypothetical protein
MKAADGENKTTENSLRYAQTRLDPLARKRAIFSSLINPRFYLNNLSHAAYAMCFASAKRSMMVHECSIYLGIANIKWMGFSHEILRS